MNIAEAPAKFLAADLLARFAAIVGDKNAITDREAQAPYLTEPRDMFRGSSPVVLRPGSVAEVAEILKLANDAGVDVVSIEPSLERGAHSHVCRRQERRRAVE